jgi:RNA polymerase sigma-70 factor (ECF subfamily)
LMAALNGLPEMFRETVVLCDIEGLGYEEIAKVLGINIGTVKSRLARGREQLRKRLGGF